MHTCSDYIVARGLQRLIILPGIVVKPDINATIIYNSNILAIVLLRCVMLQKGSQVTKLQKNVRLT